ncbi:MAG: hypothetical protein LBJ11_04590, partial [Oscillospiraceae bacterium]|nr:hypothetical protein [Oscillospiraceae bacterium]
MSGTAIYNFTIAEEQSNDFYATFKDVSGTAIGSPTTLVDGGSGTMSLVSAAAAAMTAAGIAANPDSNGRFWYWVLNDANYGTNTTQANLTAVAVSANVEYRLKSKDAESGSWTLSYKLEDLTGGYTNEPQDSGNDLQGKTVQLTSTNAPATFTDSDGTVYYRVTGHADEVASGKLGSSAVGLVAVYNRVRYQYVFKATGTTGSDTNTGELKYGATVTKPVTEPTPTDSSKEFKYWTLDGTTAYTAWLANAATAGKSGTGIVGDPYIIELTAFLDTKASTSWEVVYQLNGTPTGDKDQGSFNETTKDISADLANFEKWTEVGKYDVILSDTTLPSNKILNASAEKQEYVVNVRFAEYTVTYTFNGTSKTLSGTYAYGTDLVALIEADLGQATTGYSYSFTGWANTFTESGIVKVGKGNVTVDVAEAAGNVNYTVNIFKLKSDFTGYDSTPTRVIPRSGQIAASAAVKASDTDISGWISPSNKEKLDVSATYADGSNSFTNNAGSYTDATGFTYAIASGAVINIYVGRAQDTYEFRLSNTNTTEWTVYKTITVYYGQPIDQTDLAKAKVNDWIAAQGTYGEQTFFQWYGNEAQNAAITIPAQGPGTDKTVKVYGKVSTAALADYHMLKAFLGEEAYDAVDLGDHKTIWDLIDEEPLLNKYLTPEFLEMLHDYTGVGGESDASLPAGYEFDGATVQYVMGGLANADPFTNSRMMAKFAYDAGLTLKMDLGYYQDFVAAEQFKVDRMLEDLKMLVSLERYDYVRRPSANPPNNPVDNGWIAYNSSDVGIGVSGRTGQFNPFLYQGYTDEITKPTGFGTGGRSVVQHYPFYSEKQGSHAWYKLVATAIDIPDERTTDPTDTVPGIRVDVYGKADFAVSQFDATWVTNRTKLKLVPVEYMSTTSVYSFVPFYTGYDENEESWFPADYLELTTTLTHNDPTDYPIAAYGMVYATVATATNNTMILPPPTPLNTSPIDLTDPIYKWNAKAANGVGEAYQGNGTAQRIYNYETSKAVAKAAVSDQQWAGRATSTSSVLVTGSYEGDLLAGVPVGTGNNYRMTDAVTNVPSPSRTANQAEIDFHDYYALNHAQIAFAPWDQDGIVLDYSYKPLVPSDWQQFASATYEIVGGHTINDILPSDVLLDPYFLHSSEQGAVDASKTMMMRISEDEFNIMSNSLLSYGTNASYRGAEFPDLKLKNEYSWRQGDITFIYTTDNSPIDTTTNVPWGDALSDYPAPAMTETVNGGYAANARYPLGGTWNTRTGAGTTGDPYVYTVFDYSNETMPNEDLTLYFIPAPAHDIKFIDAKTGNAIATYASVVHGTDLTAPTYAVPSKSAADGVWATRTGEGTTGDPYVYTKVNLPADYPEEMPNSALTYCFLPYLTITLQDNDDNGGNVLATRTILWGDEISGTTVTGGVTMPAASTTTGKWSYNGTELTTPALTDITGKILDNIVVIYASRTYQYYHVKFWDNRAMTGSPRYDYWVVIRDPDYGESANFALSTGTLGSATGAAYSVPSGTSLTTIAVKFNAWLNVEDDSALIAAADLVGANLNFYAELVPQEYTVTYYDKTGTGTALGTQSNVTYDTAAPSAATIVSNYNTNTLFLLNPREKFVKWVYVSGPTMEFIPGTTKVLGDVAVKAETQAETPAYWHVKFWEEVGMTNLVADFWVKKADASFGDTAAVYTLSTGTLGSAAGAAYAVPNGSLLNTGTETFTAWLNVVGNAALIANSAVVGSDLNYYASFGQVPFTLTFKDAKGNVLSSDSTMHHDDALTFPETTGGAPVYTTGYEFAYWYEEGDASKTPVVTTGLK